MGQCYPSKTCQRSSFYDLPAHSLPAHNHSLTAPRGRKSSTRRPHHSYPPHNFHTMYKRSQIVSKQLFLNSGFMEDDYIYSPYQPDPSIISENTTFITETSANRSVPNQHVVSATFITETSANRSVPNQHVVSATFAYSASSTCNPTFRVNSDNKVPKLVFDITDPAPNCTTSRDNHYPVVTRVSLDSMNSDKSSTSHPGDIGRHGDKPLETVAYF